MNMQDNEFDDLFRNKLDNFEAEPTGKVWPGIHSELNKNDTGKRGFFILKIAASIVVLLAAGLLFIPKSHQDQQQKPNKIVKSNPKAEVTKPEQAPVVTPVTKDEQLVAAMVQHNHTVPLLVVNKRNVVKERSVKNATINNNQQETIAKIEPTAPVIASQKPDVKVPSATPDTTAHLIAKADVPDIAPAKVKPIIIAQAPVNNTPKTVVKRRGIHNFGELVNLVVAKVDKRKDKAIEFSDSDDDDSSVTGINIGPFKIKKENNKD
ncbi:MAG: hypothetical protein ACTHJ8_11330 [Mucilaginibacter sp.]